MIVAIMRCRTVLALALAAAAGTALGARVYPTGGHIWVGREAELFASVNAFLRRVQPQPQ